MLTQSILASSAGSSEQQVVSSERMFVLKREGEAYLSVSVSGGGQTGKACRLYFSGLNGNKTAVETKHSLRK